MSRRAIAKDWREEQGLMVSQSKKPVEKQGRDSLVKLRAHVDNVAKRLDRANSLSRASLKALSSSIEDFDARGSQYARSTDLTAQINALSGRFDALMEKTRQDVAHDLQVVMADPRMETVSAALTKANRRISSAEEQQTLAITQINNQIAKLAGAIDERMQQEVRTRQSAHQSLQEDLAKRIDEVENSSVDALSVIGEKVVEVSDDLRSQAEDLSRDVAEKNLTLQHDYEEHKSDMARRVEALEDDQRNTIPSLERRMVTMTTRLEIMEAEKPVMPENPVNAAPPMPSMPREGTPSPAVPEPALAPEPARSAPDAFSPSEAVQLQAVAPPENSYVEQGDMAALGGGQSTQPFAPQEFSLQEYEPSATPTLPAESAYAPFNLQTGAFEQDNISPPPFSDTPPPMANSTSMPAMELEETMDHARPGVDPKAKKKRKKVKKPRPEKTIEGRMSPVRAALLMSGVAVVGVFAAKSLLPKVLGSKPVATKTERPPVRANAARPQARQIQTGSRPNRPEARPIQSVAAIGDYSDTMKAPDLGQVRAGKPSKEKVTLKVAASKGDPVAQFQLGLTHLEAGRNAQAVRLIRLAANQGQAAAQYRLGKLYESGLGVEANMQTAKQMLERAAAGGNRIAMHDLGHYYATGAAGGEPDIAKAVSWFKEAAERGVLDSQFNLGVLYQGGSGIEKNILESYIWYAIAGAQGDQLAAQRKGIVADTLETTQLATASARVKAFTPKRINEAANGVFRNLPWSRVSKPLISANTSVKSAQEMLASLGYDVGSPDGAMGPKTRNAVINFERANGLPETGRVNADLVERLTLASNI